jgi:hypothetical protein
MSLKKLIEVQNTGINAEHWFIANVNIDFTYKQISVNLEGYKSKQDRLDGKSPIPSANINFPIRNWKTRTVDEEGVETVINHRDYADFMTPELKQLLRAEIKTHIRTIARNTELSDSVDD